MMANAKSMINERKTQLSAMMPAPPPKPSLVFIRERERERHRLKERERVGFKIKMLWECL